MMYHSYSTKIIRIRVNDICREVGFVYNNMNPYLSLLPQHISSSFYMCTACFTYSPKGFFDAFAPLAFLN